MAPQFYERVYRSSMDWLAGDDRWTYQLNKSSYLQFIKLVEYIANWNGARKPLTNDNTLFVVTETSIIS